MKICASVIVLLLLLLSWANPSDGLSSPQFPASSTASDASNAISRNTRSDDAMQPSQEAKPPRSKLRQRIPVIRYENQWVCVSKPAGMTMHRSRHTPRTQPVLNTSIKRQLARKVFPVHRLDHRTSGAVLFGFDSQTSGKLHQAIKDGTKQYIALCRGEWGHETESITIDKRLRIKDEYKDAVTKFTVLASTVVEEARLPETDASTSQPPYNMTRCCIVLCEPVTGRTHQIRRHAYAMGHPVLGDTDHGDSRANRWWRQNHELNRLALHCLCMDFELDACPETVVAPLGDELLTVLQTYIPDVYAEALAKDPRLSLRSFDETGGSKGRHFRTRKDDDDDSGKDVASGE